MGNPSQPEEMEMGRRTTKKRRSSAGMIATRVRRRGRMVHLVAAPVGMTNLHDFIALGRQTRIRDRRCPTANHDGRSSHD